MMGLDPIYENFQTTVRLNAVEIAVIPDKKIFGRNLHSKTWRKIPEQCRNPPSTCDTKTGHQERTPRKTAPDDAMEAQQ